MNTIPQNNLIITLLTSKRLSWVRHLMLVIGLAIVYYLFQPDTIRKFAILSNLPFEILYIGTLIEYCCSLMLIYINLYILFPKYFQKGMFNKYLAGILLLGSIYFIVTYFIKNAYVKYYGAVAQKGINIDLNDFVSVTLFPIVFLLATTGFKVFKQWMEDKNKFLELEQEKLTSELQQLKNQVNPHFLFNTLNNLHVLINTDAPKASEIVLGLSDVLRYQIYDSQNETISLKKDIEIIEQFVALEKIRRNDLSVDIKTKGDLTAIAVPPLLFTNFVDNAIKHSSSRDASFINMLFERIGQQLHFTIENSVPAIQLKQSSSGFGLKNVTKRLNLLYGDDYSLEINKEKTFFTVKLIIPL